MTECKSNKDKYEDDIDKEIEKLKKDFIELIETANEKQTKELKEDIRATNTRVETINTRMEENFRAINARIEENSKSINSRIDQIHIRLDQIMQMLAERR